MDLRDNSLTTLNLNSLVVSDKLQGGVNELHKVDLDDDLGWRPTDPVREYEKLGYRDAPHQKLKSKF